MHQAVHETEAFGPVATLMSYDGLEQAVQLAALGGGSLVGSLITADSQVAQTVIRAAARVHGRMLILNEAASAGLRGMARLCLCWFTVDLVVLGEVKSWAVYEQ